VSASFGRPTRAIVFDLWDTLVPFPLDQWDELTRALADALAVPHDRLRTVWDTEAHQRMTRPMEECLRRAGLALGAVIEETFVSEEMSRRQRFHEACLMRPRPEALPTLKRLRDAGLRIGMVSNATSDVPVAWPRSPLAPLIDVAVFSAQQGVTKPDRRIYERATEDLEVHPDEVVYVGDGAGDELAGAQRVGMRPIQLKYPGAPEREWLGEWIASLDQLPERLSISQRPVQR